MATQGEEAKRANLSKLPKLGAHLLISGRVQGVFYRDFLKTLAEEENLAGWVRNLADGRVEAYLEGEEDSLKRVIERAKKGPPLAKVTEVRVNFSKDLKNMDGFQILA